MNIRQSALAQPPVNKLVAQFMDFYSDFSLEALNQLDEIHTQDIEFCDPVHSVYGGLALKSYMRKMALNLEHYKIRYLDSIKGDNSAYFTWEMDYRHKSIGGGKMITLRGMTHIKYTTKIYYHEDSYDLGAMVYDHLPVLGALTGKIKKRMTK